MGGTSEFGLNTDTLISVANRCTIYLKLFKKTVISKALIWFNILLIKKLEQVCRQSWVLVVMEKSHVSMYCCKKK